jgi:hypothetical protein
MAKARGFLTPAHEQPPVSLPFLPDEPGQNLSMPHHPDNFRDDPL